MQRTIPAFRVRLLRPEARSHDSFWGTVMRRLAIFVVRRRWWVVAAALVAVPLLGSVRRQRAQQADVSGYRRPGFRVVPGGADRSSAVPERRISRTSSSSSRRSRGTVNSPAVVAAGAAITKRIAKAKGVTSTASYWSLNRLPQLRSRDSTQAIVVASLHGDEAEQARHWRPSCRRSSRRTTTP